MMNENLKIEQLPIDCLIPFRNHPFKTYEGQRLAEMVASIETSGIYVPITVQPAGKDAYEILSGHNRVKAATEAGLESVPAIIREELTDDEALLIVTETNLYQRSFADLTHSERAVALAVHYDAIKSQGKRNDLIKEVENLLVFGVIESVNKSSALIEQKLKSGAREKTGATFGLDRNTVARYLRVNKLIEPLKERLDAGDIGLYAAVSLSHLSEDEQLELEICLEENRTARLDMRKAEILRNASNEQPLSGQQIAEILSGEVPQEPEKASVPSVRLGSKLLKNYFEPGDTAEYIEDAIREALELWLRRNK
jgi:ParB family chromosome partitioning protein